MYGYTGYIYIYVIYAQISSWGATISAVLALAGTPPRLPATTANHLPAIGGGVAGGGLGTGLLWALLSALQGPAFVPPPFEPAPQVEHQENPILVELNQLLARFGPYSHIVAFVLRVLCGPVVALLSSARRFLAQLRREERPTQNLRIAR